MRLLLDEHFPSTIAEQLRRRGHDVWAVQELPALRGLSDPALFEAAQQDRRALCTENVCDFLPLDAEARAAQRAHHGLVFTTDRSFPRGHRRTIGSLVKALNELLRQPRSEFLGPDSRVIWLQSVDEP